jgi:hypothetical protein
MFQVLDRWTPHHNAIPHLTVPVKMMQATEAWPDVDLLLRHFEILGYLKTWLSLAHEH